MVKSMMFAGMFAMGVTAPVFAETLVPDGTAPGTALAYADNEHGCNSASGSWLPGTLQIDDGTRTKNQAAPAEWPRRGQTPADCAHA